jgi:hypothetical protein
LPALRFLLIFLSRVIAAFFVLRRIVLFHIELKMGFSLLEYVTALLDMHWWWKAGSTRLRRPSDWAAVAEAVAEGELLLLEKNMHLPRAESAGRRSGLLLLRSAAVREGGGRRRERVLQRLGGGVLPPRPLVTGGASWSPQPPAPTTRTASGCSFSLSLGS